MGLTGAGLNRFRARVDEAMRDAFPVKLLIRGKAVTAASPGARTGSDFLAGGLNPTFRISFRIPKSAFPGKPPEVGESFEWFVDGREIPLEITDLSLRTAEDVYPVTCKYRLV
jgi:hypothetical protein